MADTEKLGATMTPRNVLMMIGLGAVLAGGSGAAVQRFAGVDPAAAQPASGVDPAAVQAAVQSVVTRVEQIEISNASRDAKLDAIKQSLDDMRADVRELVQQQQQRRPR